MGSSRHGRRAPGAPPRLRPRPVQAAPGLTGRVGNWDELRLPRRLVLPAPAWEHRDPSGAARSSNRAFGTRGVKFIVKSIWRGGIKGEGEGRGGHCGGHHGRGGVWRGTSASAGSRGQIPIAKVSPPPLNLEFPRDPDGFTGGILPGGLQGVPLCTGWVRPFPVGSRRVPRAGGVIPASRLRRPQHDLNDSFSRQLPLD